MRRSKTRQSRASTRRLTFQRLDDRLLLAGMTVQFQYQAIKGAPGNGQAYSLGLFPIADAQVLVSGPNGNTTTSTSPTGTLTIVDDQPYTFTILTKFRAPNMASFQVTNPNTGNPWQQSFQKISALQVVAAADGTKTLTETVSLTGTDPTDPAFAIFETIDDAAAYARTIAPKGVTAGPLDVEYPQLNNPSNGKPMQGAFFVANAVNNPALGGTIYAAYDMGMSFSLFAHEYGHYVASSLGFFANIATPVHSGSENFRYTSPNPPQAAEKGLGMMQALNEGWADYFAVAAQAYAVAHSGGALVGGVVSGPAGAGIDAPTSYVQTRIDKASAVQQGQAVPSVDFDWAASLPTDNYAVLTNDGLSTGVSPGQGEDNEATVARIFFRLHSGFTASNGTTLTLDDATLIDDLQQMFKAQAVGGFTQNGFWNLVTGNQNSGVPSNQTFAFGELFSQQGAGVTLLSPAPVANFTRNTIPTFTFSVPRAYVSSVQPYVRKIPLGAPVNLLNTFTIHFAVSLGPDASGALVYQDITARALLQKGLPKDGSTFPKNVTNSSDPGLITFSWTPTAAQWAAVIKTAGPLLAAAKSTTLTWFVVAGDLGASLPDSYKNAVRGFQDTRNYWSASSTINILPLPRVGDASVGQGDLASDSITDPGNIDGQSVEYQVINGSAAFGSAFWLTDSSGAQMAQSGTVVVPADDGSGDDGAGAFNFTVHASNTGATQDQTATIRVRLPGEMQWDSIGTITIAGTQDNSGGSGSGGGGDGDGSGDGGEGASLTAPHLLVWGIIPADAASASIPSFGFSIVDTTSGTWSGLTPLSALPASLDVTFNIPGVLTGTLHMTPSSGDLSDDVLAAAAWTYYDPGNMTLGVDPITVTSSLPLFDDSYSMVVTDDPTSYLDLPIGSIVGVPADGTGSGGAGGGGSGSGGGDGNGSGGGSDNPGTTFTVTALASSTTYNAAPGVFEITRSGGDITKGATASPTIEGTAPDSDYILDGSYYFAPNVSAILVQVRPTWQSKLENVSSETVELSIDNGLDDADEDQTSQATVTINIPPKPVVTISGDANISEQWGSTVLWLTRTGDTSDSLTLPYELGGDASNGQDYFYLFGDVTFLAGESTAPIVVAAVDQGLVSGSETMTVMLDPGDEYNLGDESTASVTIVNDDPVYAANGGRWQRRQSTRARRCSSRRSTPARQVTRARWSARYWVAR